MSILSQSSDTPIMENNSQAVGLWGFDFFSPAPDVIGNHPTSIINFLLEEEFLTIRLIDVSGMPEPGSDEFFKLRTKWEGKELLYLPPGGNWQTFAHFEEGVFKMQGHERTYQFKRVQADELPKWNSDLLRESRTPFVYEED